MRYLAIVVALAAIACNVTGTFVCETSDQCRRGGDVGHCEASGFCSFDDLGCPSQRRYDPSATATLAGECVADVVTGRLRQVYATNDAAFMPTVLDYTYPAATVVATVRLDDGTPATVSYADDGTFWFSLATPGQTYALALTVGGTVNPELQHAAPHLELVEHAVGRPDRRPVTQPTTIQFQYTNNIANEAVVTSTGTWSQTPTAQNGSFFDYRWDTSASLDDFGPVGLLDASQHDVVYLTKHTSNAGVTTIAAAASTSFTQTDGVSHVVAGMLTATPATECKRVVAPAADALTRLTSALPEIYAAGLFGWQILAVPSIDRLGNAGALTLVSGGGPTATNIDVMQMYANPYVGTSAIAAMTLLEARTLVLSTATSGMFISNGVYVAGTFPAGTTCAADAATLTWTASVPGMMSLAGTPLDVDEKPVTLDRTHPIPLTWTIASPGPVDLIQIELDEVTVDLANVTITQPIRRIDCALPSATIDPSLLLPGHVYIVAVSSYRGASGSATGNYEPFTLPIELARSWSRSFRVQ